MTSVRAKSLSTPDNRCSMLTRVDPSADQCFEEPRGPDGPASDRQPRAPFSSSLPDSRRNVAVGQIRVDGSRRSCAGVAIEEPDQIGSPARGSTWAAGVQRGDHAEGASPPCAVSAHAYARFPRPRRRGAEQSVTHAARSPERQILRVGPCADTKLGYTWTA